MLTSYLFPHRFKWFGWVLLVAAGTLGILETGSLFKLPPLVQWLPSLLNDSSSKAFSPSPRENYDLYAVLFIVGGLLAACSRERHEDEYISKIRLEALLWTMYVYSGLLALAFLLVSGGWFIPVLELAMFAPILLFALRFQWVLRLTSRTLPDEK
ncbi:MAG: hypothetical protein ACRYFX_09055 [Janthinobacterium lividum]